MVLSFWWRFWCSNWHILDPNILLLEIYPGKEITNVYKMCHQGGSSQPEAVGGIPDAISVKVNTGCFGEKTRRQHLPNWPFPHPRPLERLRDCLWWVGGRCREGEGQGTGAGETGGLTPIATGPAPLLSVLHSRLMGKLS